MADQRSPVHTTKYKQTSAIAIGAEEVEMVHSAYDSFELLSGCSKIETIASYGSKLLLGCADGSLRIYAPGSSDSDVSDYLSQTSHEIRKESYTLEKSISGFFKKPLLAMETVESRQFLLSLSDSITVHRLPNFQALAVINKAKGANLFSWNDRRGFLSFARQKKVCIFRHDDGKGFVEVKEFSVPDVVKSMSWCGENICLGIKKEYMILSARTGALSQVFTTGRLASPLVVSLPTEELLLGKENIGVFVDPKGKLLPEGRICWSEAPTSVTIQKPYAIAQLPRFIEVRSLRDPYPLIQTVVLRNVRRIRQCNNVVIVSTENSVHGLFPVPLGAQIVQLTASGNFEEALSLCKLLPLEESSLRAAKEVSIHLRYAHFLFDNGSYEKAMEHFLASQVEITYVLSLYPSIILPQTTAVVHDSEKSDGTGDASNLSRGSSGMSDDIEPFAPAQLSESDGSASLESKKMNHNALMSLVKYLQKKRFGIIEKATAERTEEVVLDAVGDHSLSLNATRLRKTDKGHGGTTISSDARDMASVLDTALLQALVLTGQSSSVLELLKGVNYCHLKICEEILGERNNKIYLLELYKSNSMHHDALELLHKLLEESKLDPQADATLQFKPEHIIEYLKPLCETDHMLVLEFAMLVLESCPRQTIELFLTGNIPADLVNSYLKQHFPSMQATYLEMMLAMNENGISGNLQNEMIQIYLSEVIEWYGSLSAKQKWDEKAYSPTRKKLLSYLEGISGYNPEALLKLLPPDGLYEERAIILGKMNQHELALSMYVHKLQVPELALSYCDRVYQSLVNQPSAKSAGNIYLTLLQIYLNPRRSTKKFEKKNANLVSPRSTSSPKFGSVTSFKSKGSRGSMKIAAIEGAEDLRVGLRRTQSARRDGDADADEQGEEVVSSINLDKVLDVLSRKWDRINGAQALRLLPGETKLQSMNPFLGPLVRKSSENHRNYSVIKSLRQSENLQVKDGLYNQRKAVVKITGDSMCCLCNKKIGTSVFAVYPNGKTIVHFVCFRDSQTMKSVNLSKGSALRKQ